jgi:hypothetical protein
MSAQSFVTHRLYLGTQVILMTFLLSAFVFGTVMIGNAVSSHFDAVYEQTQASASKLDQLGQLAFAIKEMHFPSSGYRKISATFQRR